MKYMPSFPYICKTAVFEAVPITSVSSKAAHIKQFNMYTASFVDKIFVTC